MTPRARDSRRNARTALILFSVVAGMIGLSFASAPLYRVFCQVTGFGGTTQVSEVAPGAGISDRVIEVQFNADVDPNLPWSFQPVQRAVKVRIGEPGLAYYRAHNLSDQAIVGAAAYNVTPFKAGYYFDKIQCFCFSEQRLEPGEVMDMAVSFFVDPSILEDRNLDDVKTITLSYTFFRQADDETPPAPKQLSERKAPGSAPGSAPGPAAVSHN